MQCCITSKLSIFGYRHMQNNLTPFGSYYTAFRIESVRFKSNVIKMMMTPWLLNFKVEVSADFPDGVRKTEKIVIENHPVFYMPTGAPSFICCTNITDTKPTVTLHVRSDSRWTVNHYGSCQVSVSATLYIYVYCLYMLSFTSKIYISRCCCISRSQFSS